MVASNICYLAYVLEGRTGSVIRLIRRDNSFRALLKGFVGAVMDVAFCHSRSNLLACLDEGGNLHIWDLDMAKVEASVQKLVCEICLLLFSVVSPIMKEFIYFGYILCLLYFQGNQVINPWISYH